MIGWQIDNETSAYGCPNASVHRDFIDWLRARYKTVQALNDAWVPTYWGQNVDRWGHLPTRNRIDRTWSDGDKVAFTVSMTPRLADAAQSAHAGGTRRSRTMGARQPFLNGTCMMSKAAPTA